MVRKVIEPIPLTIRVIQTSIGNCFAHIPREGREINLMARTLRPPYGVGGYNEVLTVHRKGEIIAEARIYVVRGDVVLTWKPCNLSFADNGHDWFNAEAFEAEDIIRVQPDCTKSPMPFFDRIFFVDMADITRSDLGSAYI